MVTIKVYRVNDKDMDLEFFGQVTDSQGRILLWAWGKDVQDVEAKIKENLLFVQSKVDDTKEKLLHYELNIADELAKNPVPDNA